MRIYDCKINHRTNPIGYLMNRVTVAWKVDEVKGLRQASARLCVSEDANMKELQFDSGWDEKISSLGTVLPIELKPRTRYYLTVSVKTDLGEEATSNIQWFETSKMEEEWKAQWISCNSEEKRHPLFEKRIEPEKTVKNARLYISGLGLYEAYYNDTKIGNEYLSPYSNNYKRWIQYQTYDITEQLQTEGTLSILLGNGWYKGRFGFDPKKVKGFYGDEWKVIAEVRITYEDETETIIGTDDSWIVRRSNILFSNIYDGEHRDDTLEILPDEKVILSDPPQGKLTARMSTPVTIHEHFNPVEVIHTPKDELVLDLGQEFAGIFRLHIKEAKGSRIRIQTGELLQDGCFYNGNLRSAKSEYIYISDGVEKDIVPHFTYYGYRYVKLEGITDFHIEDFTGLALYSDIQSKGTIVTGNELVNKLVSNIRWGLKSNFVDVPTDCPQRDERMGWTGDAQVFCSTACYLEDTYAFYEKYVYDMWQEQIDLGGKVPDVVPSCGVESVASVWGDASCIIPWNLYLFYGDKGILEDQFDSMKAWVDYVSTIDGEDHGWRNIFHYGDWLALDNPNEGDDQVLGGTDEDFIANVYYAASAEILANVSAVLGRNEEEKKYRQLAKEQFNAVKKEYYSVTGRCCIKTQTALILTLKYNLSDNVEWTKNTLRKLFADNNDKLKTGFVGTPLLGTVLSDNGFSDLAYSLLLNEEYPGWLHEIKLGATTVWERWNSVLDNGSISSTGMNSLNHYSYGSIAEWMFSHAAGIQQIKGQTGFKKVYLCPELNWKIRSIEAAFDSPVGKYEIQWEMTDPTHVNMKVLVPFDGEAYLRLPDAKENVYENNTSNPIFADVSDGICHLLPGIYQVTYETERSLKKSYSVDTPVRVLFADSDIAEWLGKIIPYKSIFALFRGHSLLNVIKELDIKISTEVLHDINERLSQY